MSENKIHSQKIPMHNYTQALTMREWLNVMS